MIGVLEVALVTADAGPAWSEAVGRLLDSSCTRTQTAQLASLVASWPDRSAGAALAEDLLHQTQEDIPDAPLEARGVLRGALEIADRPDQQAVIVDLLGWTRVAEADGWKVGLKRTGPESQAAFSRARRALQVDRVLRPRSPDANLALAGLYWDAADSLDPAWAGPALDALLAANAQDPSDMKTLEWISDFLSSQVGTDQNAARLAAVSGVSPAYATVWADAVAILARSEARSPVIRALVLGDPSDTDLDRITGAAVALARPDIQWARDRAPSAVVWTNREVSDRLVHGLLSHPQLRSLPEVRGLVATHDRLVALARGHSAALSGDPATALASLNEAEPDRPPEALFAVSTLRALGNHDGAVAVSNLALAANPDDHQLAQVAADALITRGIQFLTAGDLEPAAVDLGLAARLIDPEGQRQPAVDTTFFDLIDRARLADADRLLTWLSPDGDRRTTWPKRSPLLDLRLGQAARTQGDHAAAARHLRHATANPEGDPKRADGARFLLADTLIRQHDLTGAMAQLTPLAERNPEAAWLLTRVKVLAGDFEGAKTNVSSGRAEELDRLITTAQAVLQARRARHATDPSAAHKALRDAEEAWETPDADALVTLGGGWMDVGEPDEAANRYTAALALEPTHTGAREGILAVSLTTGQWRLRASVPRLNPPTPHDDLDRALARLYTRSNPTLLRLGRADHTTIKYVCRVAGVLVSRGATRVAWPLLAPLPEDHPDVAIVTAQLMAQAGDRAGAIQHLVKLNLTHEDYRIDLTISDMLAESGQMAAAQAAARGTTNRLVPAPG